MTWDHHLAVSAVGLLTNHVLLEVEDVDIDIFTGVYSSETRRPQPLRITVRAWLGAANSFAAGDALDASIDYMRLKDAIGALPVDRHFTLIEAVADQLIAAIFGIDTRIAMIEVQVVKLALSDGKQKIGVRVRRTRDAF